MGFYNDVPRRRGKKKLFMGKSSLSLTVTGPHKTGSQRGRKEKRKASLFLVLRGRKRGREGEGSLGGEKRMIRFLSPLREKREETERERRKEKNSDPVITSSACRLLPRMGEERKLSPVWGEGKKGGSSLLSI